MHVRFLGASRLAHPGESLLISRDSHGECGGAPFRAVIDLGHKSAGLAPRAAAAAPHLIVLTHDDEDHIGGAEDFFAALPTAGAKREFWLPADWMFGWLAYRSVFGLPHPRLSGPQAAQSIRITPEVVIAAIRGEPSLREYVRFVIDDERDLARDERYPDGVDSRDEPWIDPQNIIGKNRERAAVEAIAEAVELHRKIVSGGVRDNDANWSGTSQQIAQRVLDRGRKIAYITETALKLGRVRWFSVDIERARSEDIQPWASEGWPGLLTLINAREVLPPQSCIVEQSEETFLLFSRLSVQNRRALVVYAWPPRDLPSQGVLVWSDSDGTIAEVDGAVLRTPWHKTTLMTAPHHGSRAKEHSLIWKSTPPGVSVILSNNRELTTPAYYDAKAGWARGCTRCPFHSSIVDSEDVAAAIAWNGWEISNSCEVRYNCFRP